MKDSEKKILKDYYYWRVLYRDRKTRELVKLSVLKNAVEDPYMMGEALAERSSSTLVEIIGRKIVLYKSFKDDPQIKLPK